MASTISLDVPGYQVERPLKIGGFGAVYLATRKNDGAKVAIKVMRPEVAVDEMARQKFLREIRNLKRLRHDHVVSLIENGSVGNEFYFVMEFCDAGSVGDLVKAGGGHLTLSEAGPIMLQALEGLAFAHKSGYVHRDLKPDNLLLAGTGGETVAKVGDFGLGKCYLIAGFSGLTDNVEYAGTRDFMPREQVVIYRDVKPVSDVWSMGATFYNMLTGRVPRDIPPGIEDPRMIVLEGAVVPILKRRANVPRKVAEVIDRCLTNDIKERYQDAEQMRIALAGALSS